MQRPGLRSLAAVTLLILCAATIATAEPSIEELLDAVKEHYDAGDIEQALSLTDTIIEREHGNANAWHYRCHCYSDQERFNEALVACSNAIEFDPTSTHYYIVRSAVYRLLDRYEEAWSDALQAHLLDPAQLRPLVQLANAAYMLRRSGDAKRLLDHALVLHPDAPSALQLRARVHEDLDLAEAALKDINRTLEVWPDNAYSFLVRAEVYMSLDRMPDARDDIQRSAEIEPDNPYLHFTRATFHYNRNEYELAERNLIDALDAGLDHARTHIALALAREVLGKFELALQSWDQALVSAPDVPELYTMRADLLRSLKRYNEARDAYLHALSLDPDSDDAIIGYVRTYADATALDEGHAHIDSLLADERSKQNVLLKATLHAEAHEYGPAIELFEEALTLSESSEWVFAMLVDLHWNNGDLQAALNAADRYLFRFPNSYDAFHWRYSVLNQLDRYHDALEMAQEMVRLREDAFSYELVGYAQYSLGEFEQAIESLTTSETLGSDSADTPGYHGLSLYAMNQSEECLVYLDEAIERAGDAASYWLWWRAEVHEEMDNPDLAMADYDLALALTPDHTSLLESRAELKFELGDFEAAYTDFQNIIALEPENEDAWLRSIDAKVESGNILATFFEFYRYGAARNASTQGEEPFLDYIDRYWWILANAVFMFGVALVGLTVAIVLHRQKKASQSPKP